MKVDVKDRKTQLIIGGIVVGLGVLIYFLFKNKPLGVEVMEIPDQTMPEPSTLDVNLVLKQGSENPEVAEMQRILIEKYGQNLGAFGDNKDGIDGIFGTVTLAGLLKAKNVSQIALKDL
jgi:peptidoglycan hydrolase-like protein with peptidoglycan-binding domain